MYADRLYELRERKRVTRHEAGALVEDSNYLGSVMVKSGDADAMLTGLITPLPVGAATPLQVIGTAPDAGDAADVYTLTSENRMVFCADATANQDPGADVPTEVIRRTAEFARRSDVQPRAAVPSYSNFRSVDDEGTQKPREAARRLRKDSAVDSPVDGGMQADTAMI